MINIACYYPLIAVRSKDSGSVAIQGSFREHYDAPTFMECSAQCRAELTNYAIWSYAKKHSKLASSFFGVETIELPCGRCIGCRLEYSRQWANRCVLESLAHPQGCNWFLTLTIDDDHIKEHVTKNGFATVFNDDISKFMKALRQRWSKQHGIDSKIRFFGSSEYGGDSMRPHYHILCFGLPLYDLEYYKNNFEGDVLYKSKELDEVWKKGFVTVGEFNWNTAAYTARYVMKKCNGSDAAAYEALGLQPEKSRMSRRPGIAADFLAANIDSIYDLDEIVLSSVKGNLQVISPPKYFDKQLKHINPSLFEALKRDRMRIAELREKCKEQRHGYDPVEYLDIQQDSKISSMKIFKRS